jgi:hypothetical protein
METNQSIRRSNVFKILGIFIICLLFSNKLSAQVLDYNNKVTLALSDGTTVILYGKAKTRNNNFTGQYYYLPVNLHLTKKEDGTPEFLFLKYTSDKTEANGGAQGGLMHFLMSWGLTPEQEAEAQIKLKEKISELKKNSGSPYKSVSNPTIVGAADVTVEDGKSFRVISSILTDDGMATVVASGNATSLPGAKIAVAAKLDSNATQLLAATLEKNRSISDVSIELSFKYNLLFPAIDGMISINWSKVQTSFESFSSTYSHNDKDTKSGSDDSYSYEEVSKIYESMRESKAVIFDIDNNSVDDALANEIVQSFLTVFTDALTDRDMDSAPTPVSQDEKEANPNYKYGSSYKYNSTKAERRYQRVTETYHLKYRTAISKSFTLTGNLGSWYDGVRDNPRCVSEINLNDPFFERRNINLILDLEAEDMFGSEVNYVTVKVRKKRKSGHDFEDHVTIDRNYLKSKGVFATLTYARDQDKNNDTYEYSTQWSLRGGKVFPEKMEWFKGEWEGVTLATPIKPRLIELEGDLDELKDNKITRVTAVIRYYKFGEEIETNIPLTVSKGEPLVPKTIYTDRDTRGYAYRLIFTHKTEGKLATEWDANINDDYMFASIPEEFKDTESPVFKAAKKAGDEIIETAADKVLDKFKNLIKSK